MPDRSSEAVVNNPFFGQVSPNPPRDLAPAGRSCKLPFMNGDPNLVEGTTRAALPLNGRRDAWLEQRLGYLAADQARLKAGPPLRRFLRGAAGAYRRFLLDGRPRPPLSVLGHPSGPRAAGLDQLEPRGDRPEVAGSAPDGPGPGRPWVKGLTDQGH